jgi:hypothetical protein
VAKTPLTPAERKLVEEMLCPKCTKNGGRVKLHAYDDGPCLGCQLCGFSIGLAPVFDDKE